MIAHFRYETAPTADCVHVELLWDRGRRAGQLHVPRAISDELFEHDWPTAAAPLSIDGALAYGLMVSIRAGISLRLSGDQTVWPDEWGNLIHAYNG